MLRRAFLPILVAAALAACHDGITSVTNGVVTATREDGGIRITNQTSEARGYMANDPNWLALATLDLMALCNDTGNTCLRLPAHGSVLVPFSEVGGYGSSTTQVVVWTWRVLPSGPGGALQAETDDAITLKF